MSIFHLIVIYELCVHLMEFNFIKKRYAILIILRHNTFAIVHDCQTTNELAYSFKLLYIHYIPSS